MQPASFRRQGVDQLKKSLSSMHQTLGSMPSTSPNKAGIAVHVSNLSQDEAIEYLKNPKNIQRKTWKVEAPRQCW